LVGNFISLISTYVKKGKKDTKAKGDFIGKGKR